jgi:hypothetical protein
MGATWSNPRTRPRTYAFPVQAVGVHVKESKESVIGDAAKDRSSMLSEPQYLILYLKAQSVDSESRWCMFSLHQPAECVIG